MYYWINYNFWSFVLRKPSFGMRCPLRYAKREERKKHVFFWQSLWYSIVFHRDTTVILGVQSLRKIKKKRKHMENPGKQKATALQYQLYFCFISVFNNPNLPYRGPREPR